MKNSIPEEEIERLAYAIYLNCGRQDGRDVEHWLAAEEMLQKEQAGRLEPEPLSLKSKTASAGARGASGFGKPSDVDDGLE